MRDMTLMTPVRILAVVLHYGDPVLSRRVHEALLPGSDEHEVLVLDNAAPVPYDDALRLPENVFWGGALEKALDLARERGFQYLWFCNNDIEFFPPPSLSSPSLLARVAGRLGRMEKVLGRAVGLWAPAVTSSPYHPQMLHKQGLQYRQVAYMDGIAPLMNLACVDAVGGLEVDGNTRGYGLDLWLSLRAYEAGWPVVVDQQVVVRHRYHTTARKVDGFLQQAAQDEDCYMRVRLGEQWRDVVRTKAAQWEDISSL